MYMNMFMKLFIEYCIFLGFFITNAYSEIVNKVQVEGNDRISKETIVIFGDIKIGFNYESSDINLLIKSRTITIICCFVLGALLSPPDVLSQISLSIPLLISYEFGIIFGIYLHIIFQYKNHM